VPRLVALDLAGGPSFVTALRRAWDDGDAVAPLDPRLPAAARQRVLDALSPAAVIDSRGEHTLSTGRAVETGDAVVVATSGTTGDPKGVVLTHAALTASAEATSARIGIAADDHWLACLPLAHVGGLSVITRALVLGTPLTVLPTADPAAVTAAAHGGATLVSLVATALRRIDAALFRVVLLGGSRPPADRPANSVATYGMTETGSGVAYDGRPLDGVEIRIDDLGEIHVRGPMLLRCYLDGTDPKDANGWFATGDVGSWRDDGRLHVDGRRNELIITGGENVWPEAVEVVLQRHPAVADVAVGGRPDEEWGQVVTAYIVPTDRSAPPVLASLRDHVKQELPAYCAPHRLLVVDVVPRTALGKIRRSALTALSP
jgi:O-succinylbenzoic acid--CoA ligase